MKKPARLKKGDSLALVSPSWGGPSVCPHIYESGIKNLRELGLNIIDMPAARMDAEKLYRNPQIRAEDINNAFSDKNINGIIASIGGSDSARILKYLDTDTIKNNPKFFMGYSDTATITTWLNQHGLVTFNGPSVMGGFSQLHSFPEDYRQYIRDYLFISRDCMEIPEFPSYSEGYPEWADKNNTGKIKPVKENDGMHFIQGSGISEGELFGGCIEVLEMLKGTEYWPTPDFWQDKILFLETSEEKPSVDYVKYSLRNYGIMGVFDLISGLLFGRARDYSDQEKEKLEKTVLSVVSGEFGNPDLPVVCNMDFGHTDPQLILPLGVKYRIDAENRKVIQAESAFAEDKKPDM
ncbi:MAG: LD-carboxypeptidase [Spirochaetales bacterium]|nr:LD-carboxypeptidase [Spirochaetales bacterium]